MEKKLPNFRAYNPDTQDMLYSFEAPLEPSQLGNFFMAISLAPKSIITQSIGLKDIKGVEVYEGDIVIDATKVHHGAKYEVRYRNDGFIGISKDGDEYGPYTLRLYLNDMNPKLTVLGNIYQHSHLLTTPTN